MVVGDEEGSASQAVLASILDGWPILIMTIVMAFLSGILIWMLVSVCYHFCSYFLPLKTKWEGVEVFIFGII